MKYKPAILGTMLAIICGSSVFAGPPVPFLDDNEPGLNMLFTGDPTTTEDGCSADGPRADAGGANGKLHNDFLECDNWDFHPTQWGQVNFLQGAFILGDSPFSNDGGWKCTGNQGPGSHNPCVNSTVRAVTTFKNEPSPGPGLNDGTPMEESKDWVFAFDFKIEIPLAFTFGNDHLFQVNGWLAGDTMRLMGAGDEGNSFLPDGTPDRYRLHHGDGQGGKVTTLIDVPLSEGHMTLHYKAANRKYDLWLDDTKLVADFAAFGDGDPNLDKAYDVDYIQLGGGGISFENALYDNIILGVLAKPDGPIPGDANTDGVVDVADLGILGANFSMTDMRYTDGDFNGDHIVDVADLGILGANWSSTQEPSLSQAMRSAELSTFIPEPTTVALTTVGILYLASRYRRPDPHLLS